MKKLLFLTLSLIGSINLASAVEGWDRVDLDDAIVYTPTNITRGVTFRVSVSLPVGLVADDLENWFLNTAKIQQNALGEALQPWIVKPEKNGALGTANSYVNAEGDKMSVGYQAGILDDGRAYISQMVSSQNLFVLMKYGKQFDDVLREAQDFYVANPDFGGNALAAKTVSAAEDISPKASEQQRRQSVSSLDENSSGQTSASMSAKAPQGLKDMRGVLVFAIQPGGMFGLTSDVIATFDDGTYTSDLQRSFAEGAAASKRAKPKRWGHWRIAGDELQLKESADAQYEPTRGDWIARPGTENMKLDGCYGNITSASSSPYGGNSTVGNASSWCFRPDGRFAHSSTGFATASGSVMGGTSSSRNSGGRYRIDGYVAQFLYDDGNEVIVAFCFLNEKKSHIAINGKRYMGND